MNCSRCLHWYRAQKLIFSKPFGSLACSKQIFLLSNSEFRSDSTQFIDVKKNKPFKELQKIHVRGHRFYRRRPIEVIESVKGKNIDDYVTDVKAQAIPTVLDDDDETDISGEIKRNKKNKTPSQEKNWSETFHTDNSFHSGFNDEIIYRKDSKNQNFDQSRKKTNRKPKTNEDSDSENERSIFKGLNIQQYNRALGKVRGYIEQGKSGHYRRKQDFFYVEGWRLLAEGLSVGLKPLAIFFSRSRLFENLIPSIAKSKEELADILNMYPLYKTPYNVFTTWSSLKTPPGILAVFSTSKAIENANQLQTKNSLPLIVILDEIRDPNNMGSIMRTLVAAGVEKIILTQGCCDIWDNKVLRSTCGANFHMPCLTHVPWKSVESHLPSYPAVYLANACSKEEGNWEVPEESLPNIREMALRASKERASYIINKSGEKIRINDSYDDEDHLNLFDGIKFPEYYYNTINFFDNGPQTSDHSVLVIGGEIGLSNSARKYALEMGGAQVGIPMLNNVDSLNSSVAIGILVYEARKQYEELLKQKNRSTTAT